MPHTSLGAGWQRPILNVVRESSFHWYDQNGAYDADCHCEAASAAACPEARGMAISRGQSSVKVSREACPEVRGMAISRVCFAQAYSREACPEERGMAIAEDQTRFAFQSGLDEAFFSPLYLPLGHMASFARAANRGLNPDRPENLVAVVKL